MFYSEKHKFVYLAVPKTGSTSIRRVLAQKFGAKSLRDGHDNVIPPHMRNFFTFTCVRNPYDRAISGYFHVHRKTDKIIPVEQCWMKFHMISVSQYLRTQLYLEQHAFPQDDIDKFKIGTEAIRLDAVIKLESLEEDFARLPFVGGPVTFPIENTVQKQLLLGGRSIEVPSELIEGIPKHYHEDFLRFNYAPVAPSMKTPPIFL